jgi:hypothetical protein
VASTGTTDLRIDPTGKFLYALSQASAGSSLHVLNIASDGTLSETVAPLILPIPTGNYPIGLATLMK